MILRAGLDRINAWPKLSSDQNPEYLLYRRDEILPKSMGIAIRIQWNVNRVWLTLLNCVSVVFPGCHLS